jgi:hypothetical protein
MEDERMKFLTSRIVGWMGESKAFTNRGENEHDLLHPSQEQEEQWRNGSDRGGRRG